MKAIDSFASADYVGPKGLLPFGGPATFSKTWQGIHWFTFSALPVATAVRSTFVYHKPAVAMAVGSDVMTDITWHGDHAAHFFNSMMSLGANLIDDEGVVEILCQE